MEFTMGLPAGSLSLAHFFGSLGMQKGLLCARCGVVA